MLRIVSLRYLLFLLVLAALASAQDRRISPGPVGERKALVIGNNNYPWKPLVNSVNDATALRDMLQRVGFEPRNVILATNATLKQMQRAAREFVEKLRPEDTAVVYYSGHGVEVRGENFLIPVDFPANASELEVQDEAYSAQQLLRNMEASRARVRIVILDSCRDNPLRASRSTGGGLARMEGKGTLIVFATSASGTADDNPNGSNGLFTHRLLQALPTPGLAVDQLFKQVARQVDRDSGSRQTPMIYGLLLEDFSFVAGRPAAAQTIDPAAEAWERAKGSRNRAVFEAIIREFPDSQYARLARIELAALAPPPVVVQPFDANDAFAKAIAFYNAKDYAAALPLLRQAADAGNNNAMHWMGWSYNHGNGVVQDYRVAADWYRKGSELGNLTSANNLGTLYQSGQGVAQDYSAAMNLYRRAADGGVGMAMNNIGYLYEYGLGVPANRNEALSWYTKASNLGIEDGKKNLARLSAVIPTPPTPVVTQQQQPLQTRSTSLEPVTYNGIYHAHGDLSTLGSVYKAAFTFKDNANIGMGTLIVKSGQLEFTETLEKGVSKHNFTASCQEISDLQRVRAKKVTSFFMIAASFKVGKKTYQFTSGIAGGKSVDDMLENIRTACPNLALTEGN